MGRAGSRRNTSDAYSPMRACVRACERGELGSEPIPDRVALAVFALLRHELFFTNTNVDAAVLADIIDSVYVPLLRTISSAAQGQVGTP